MERSQVKQPQVGQWRKKIFSETRRLCLISILAVFLCSQLVAQQQTKLSFATLAPKASTWGKLITEIVRETYKRTEKKILIQVYYGGVQGDEHEIEKKIRFRQIDGGFFTGNGLGTVAHEARILEVPGYVESDNVESVYTEMQPLLNRYFEKRGYVLLGLVEVGYAYFFSKHEISNISSIAQTKMWVWKGDQLASDMMSMLKIPAIAVDFSEVIPSLQTGLIDGVYATPTALISLEWQKEVSYMLDLPVTLVSSGVVFSKKKWDTLPGSSQKIIQDVVREKLNRYRPIIRKIDAESIEVLKQQGMKILPSGNEKATIAQNSDVIGKTFPKDLQDKIKSLRK